jgi:hypothetical protein
MVTTSAQSALDEAELGKRLRSECGAECMVHNLHSAARSYLLLFARLFVRCLCWRKLGEGGRVTIEEFWRPTFIILQFGIGLRTTFLLDILDS